MYTAEVQWDNLVPYVVPASSHPIFTGTGFRNGASVPGIVGDEMDRHLPEYPLPPHTSYTLLSASPAVDVDGRPDRALRRRALTAGAAAP